MNQTLQKKLILRISDLLQNCRHVAVGASSPIPAAGALLAHHFDPQLRVSLLGSQTHTAFTDGGKELFDCAAQGRIDAFFLSGVQIDGRANINLVGTGQYPQLKQRFSGSFGSAYLYHLIPKIILFCWSHSTRTLVEKVDFISAAGPASDGVWRSGGPSVLLTDRCEFTYRGVNSCKPELGAPEYGCQAPNGFELTHLHNGETLDSIAQNTGFSYALSKMLKNHSLSTKSSQPSTVKTASEEVAIDEVLSNVILPQLAKTYPRFVKRYNDSPNA